MTKKYTILGKNYIQSELTLAQFESVIDVLAGLDEDSALDIFGLLTKDSMIFSGILKLAKKLAGAHVVERVLAILLVPEEVAKDFVNCANEANTQKWALQFSEDAIATRTAELTGISIASTIEVLTDFFGQNAGWIKNIASYFNQPEKSGDSNPDT